MKKIFLLLSLPVILFLASIQHANAVATLFSQQVGTGPVAGSVLQTNGVTSTWVATSSLGISSGGGSSTLIYSVAPITNVASGTNGQIIGFNTSTALTLSGKYTFNGGTELNATSPWTANTVQDGYNNFLINPDISLGEGVGTDTAILGDRPNVGIPVPFFTPYQANQNIAFDIFPKGPTIANGFGNSIYGAAWEDICDSDLLNFATSSYECVHIGKSLNGFGNISMSQGGSGTVRPLLINAFGGNVGIGTVLTAPTSTLTVNGTFDTEGATTMQSSLTQKGGVASLASTTINGNATTTGSLTVGSATTTFQIFSNGHINSTGTVAQVSSCGTNPSITGTDVAGEVTDGSGTDTSCTVTFQYAYGAKPIVVVTPETAGISNFGYSYTTSTITVTATSLTSDVWDYTVYAHE